MAVDETSESTQMAEVGASQEQDPSKEAKDEGVAVEDAEVAEKSDELKKEDEPKTDEIVEEKKIEGESGEASSPSLTERSDTFKEESDFVSDLRGYEKKALMELKKMLETAILGNKLFKERKVKVEEPEKTNSSEKEVEKNERGEESEDKEQQAEEGEENKNLATNEAKQEEEMEVKEGKEEEMEVKEGKEDEKPANEVETEGEEKQKTDEDVIVEEKVIQIDEDISLWGVRLLPSKGDEDTNVLLLKFLRARDFDVDEAFEMLRDTLQWRKDFKMDSLLDEDLGAEFGSTAYTSGVDREGHPICYNIYGVFGDYEFYNRTLGSEENQEKFLRWRVQLMEKGIRELDFKPGGVSSFLQINDLKNTPGPGRKELRHVTRRAVGLLQDNYPEFVARNIFINVPFWYYAFIALLSPFLTQRTKSKFVFARPSKVADTLLKYIPAAEIPVHYGGLKRDNDDEFSTKDGAFEIIVKPGLSESIEIDLPEVGTTLMWDLTVLGWEVNYREEFVPANEGSYTLIVKKGKKMSSQEGSVRNSFTSTSEPGKIVLTVENGSFNKKKRAIYRYKIKNKSSSS
ncbi:patellin-4-like [Cornus florida]|uniref:patellin-4-like n=1 Tax=Cornus florida TaxID=4283 RepID=UPI00289CDBAA|nr:patellin-4-like [Cornus florida]